MKKLIPASIFGLMFAFALRAQQPLPAVPKLTNPFLTPPANIGVWQVLKGRQDSQKHVLLVPQAQKLVPGLRSRNASSPGRTNLKSEADVYSNQISISNSTGTGSLGPAFALAIAFLSGAVWNLTFKAASRSMTIPASARDVFWRITITARLTLNPA